MRSDAFVVVVCTAMALVPTRTALAHEFETPQTVQADGAGSFSYEVRTTLTTPAAFGSLEVDGRDNTDLGWWHADGFCITTREPGSYTWRVSGKLIETGQNGSVVVRDSYCDGFTGEGTTTILAAPVDNQAQSWGAVKALFGAE